MLPHMKHQNLKHSIVCTFKLITCKNFCMHAHAELYTFKQLHIYFMPNHAHRWIYIYIMFNGIVSSSKTKRSRIQLSQSSQSVCSHHHHVCHSVMKADCVSYNHANQLHISTVSHAPLHAQFLCCIFLLHYLWYKVFLSQLCRTTESNIFLLTVNNIFVGLQLWRNFNGQRIFTNL